MRMSSNAQLHYQSQLGQYYTTASSPVLHVLTFVEVYLSENAYPAVFIVKSHFTQNHLMVKRVEPMQSRANNL